MRCICARVRAQVRMGAAAALYSSRRPDHRGHPLLVGFDRAIVAPEPTLLSDRAVVVRRAAKGSARESKEKYSRMVAELLGW